MYAALYFAHLSGLALWLGSMVTIAWLGYLALRAPRSEQQVWGLQVAGGLTTWVMTPSAAVVLVAGIAMMVVSGMIGTAKPLWFSVMEQGGGTLVLVAVVVATLLGRRLRRLSVDFAPSPKFGRSIGAYMGTLVGVTLGVVGVLLAVSLRMA